MNDPRGKAIVFTGNCKGKTTSAIGMALAHLVLGNRVFIGQFMKGGRFTGETMLEKLFEKAKFSQFGKSTIYSGDIQKGAVKPGVDLFTATKFDKKYAEEGLARCAEAARGGRYSLVVLDEINVALKMKKVGAAAVVRLLREKHPSTTIVLTGRSLDKKIAAEADVIVNVGQVKHPAEKGIAGRLGIEY